MAGGAVAQGGELRFDGEVALVTGAGRGIGRAHALLLAARGAQVVVNDAGGNRHGEAISEDPAGDVVREIEAAGGRAVADRHSVLGEAEAVVASAIEAFGRLDIVVSNAGVVRSANLADTSLADWWSAFDVHVHGTVDVAHAAWPHLARSGAGRIVNTASTALLGAPRMSNYATAKAAILGFTRTAALEGAALGIRVNCILPGAWTRLTAGMDSALLKQAMERLCPPEDVAALVAWLCHARSTVTGEAFTIGGRFASRVAIAAEAGVAVDDPTPEGWAAKADALFADGPLVRMGTMNDAFATSLRELIPDEAEEMLARIGAGG